MSAVRGHAAGSTTTTILSNERAENNTTTIRLISSNASQNNSRSNLTPTRAAVIGAVAGGVVGAGGGALVGGLIAGPPGAATGAMIGGVVGVVGGGLIGYYSVTCRHENYSNWESRVTTEYGEGNVAKGIPSALSLKEQLLSVFENDEVLRNYVDPITGALIQYPFQHPINQTYYDLNSYRIAIANNSQPDPNDPDRRPRCPYTRVLLSEVNPNGLTEDEDAQAAICNRLVYLIEEVRLSNIHSAVINGLNELKKDFDEIRNKAYDKKLKELDAKKKRGEISYTQYNQQVLLLTNRRFANSDL